MKKLLITLLVIAGILFAVLGVVHQRISVEASPDDLPKDIYQNDGNLLLIAQSKLLDLANPLSTSDEYTVTEEFINYMILYSIRTNVNEEYNPLSEDCVTTECQMIVSTDYVNVQYAYAELTEDNQLLVTVVLYREDFPETTTAIYATFDIELSLFELQLTLTLDQVFLSDIEITKDQLDSIVSFFDKDQIEDSIAMGELDLDTYQYTISLIP